MVRPDLSLTTRTRKVLLRSIAYSLLVERCYLLNNQLQHGRQTATPSFTSFLADPSPLGSRTSTFRFPHISLCFRRTSLQWPAKQPLCFLPHPICRQ